MKFDIRRLLSLKVADFLTVRSSRLCAANEKLRNEDLSYKYSDRQLINLYLSVGSMRPEKGDVELLYDRGVCQIFSDEFLCNKDSKRVPEQIFQQEQKSSKESFVFQSDLCDQEEDVRNCCVIEKSYVFFSDKLLCHIESYFKVILSSIFSHNFKHFRMQYIGFESYSDFDCAFMIV